MDTKWFKTNETTNPGCYYCKYITNLNTPFMKDYLCISNHKPILPEDQRYPYEYCYIKNENNLCDEFERVC
jgi:hypothetical protein